MGYVMELSFCEVCGKKIPTGQRFCEKHLGSKEREKEFSEDNKKDLDDKDDESEDEVLGIL
ncbi:hypothetical protein J4217_00670 [Candidatus Pacearchaeota archaeon]|nr:hypothetical protein [Candidatus Pacearchaeota archaeon]